MAAPALTPRQQEVVALTWRGLSRRAMARALCCEEATVTAHLDAAYRILGVNRGGARGGRNPRTLAAVALWRMCRDAERGRRR